MYWLWRLFRAPRNQGGGSGLTAPGALTAPSVSGSAAIGSTLTRTLGTYSGNPAPTVAGRWQRSTDAGVTWVDVSPSQTGAQYVSAGSDGNRIRWRETGSNGNTPNVTQNSNVITLTAAAAAPTALTAPNVSGSAVVGSTLTRTLGTYSGSPTPTVSGVWQRSTDAGATWADISPAQTGATYVSAGSNGDRVRLRETASNGVSPDATQNSNVTTLVASGGTQIETTFDAQYTSGFVLPQPTAPRTYVLQSEPAKTGNLTTPGGTDNYTGAKVWRLTNRATDGNVTARIRHEYSRRGPWSRDNKRYIAQSLSGFWWLFDGDTHAQLTRSGTSGALPGMAGDCEPIWSPVPGQERILWFTAINGGLVWTALNVDTGATLTLMDFGAIIPAEIAAGRLPSSFTGTARTWWKSEGRPSDDGRYWCLRAETSAFAQRGVFMYDRQTNQITGYVETTNKGDHCSTSTKGGYMLISYYDDPPTLGVRSFPRTYKGSNLLDGVKLTQGVVEHGDTCTGPGGEEYYAQVDFASGSSTEGYIRVARCDTGAAFAPPLGQIYAAPGESVSVHISGICSEKRQGWICVSTYASYQGGNPANSPASAARPQYETVYMLELKASGGKRHVVCETHQGSGNSGSLDAFFLEPQATTNYDGTRVAFGSNFIGRSGNNTDYTDSFAAYLPSTAY